MRLSLRTLLGACLLLTACQRVMGPSQAVPAGDLQAKTVPGQLIVGLRPDARDAMPRLSATHGLRPVRAIPEIGSWLVDGSDTEALSADPGVDYNLPDLAGHVEKGPDLVNDDNDPMDDHQHGTHIAGLMAADSKLKGFMGVAPGITVLAIKAMNRKRGFPGTSIRIGVPTCPWPPRPRTSGLRTRASSRRSPFPTGKGRPPP